VLHLHLSGQLSHLELIYRPLPSPFTFKKKIENGKFNKNFPFKLKLVNKSLNGGSSTPVASIEIHLHTRRPPKRSSPSGGTLINSQNFPLQQQQQQRPDGTTTKDDESAETERPIVTLFNSRPFIFQI
jgi:hypothetical protein